MPKVVVAMSGGVDSSVAAALLQAQGFEVEGVFMKNWSPETIQSLTDCPWEQDQADAVAVCEKLGIRFRSVNFEREYKQRVVDYLIAEYAAGRTPNPDILCNSEIKFRAFLDEARKMDADFIATGHYVQKQGNRIARGNDPKKDQSYFLWKLDQEQVSASLFPVGDLPKSEVRRLAAEFGLPTAAKKDSQGICFIGHIDLKQFLREHISAKPGEVYLLPPHTEGESFSSRIERAVRAGRHQGVMFHTIGERAGEVLDNGLYKKIRGDEVKPTYVLYKNVGHNRLYITDDHDDRDLYSQVIELEQWRLGENMEGESPLLCQARYQQSPIAVAHIAKTDEGTLLVRTERPLWAVAEGQSLVLYAGHLVVGGGVVKAKGMGAEEGPYG